MPLKITQQSNKDPDYAYDGQFFRNQSLNSEQKLQFLCIFERRKAWSGEVDGSLEAGDWLVISRVNVSEDTVGSLFLSVSTCPSVSTLSRHYIIPEGWRRAGQRSW